MGASQRGHRAREGGDGRGGSAGGTHPGTGPWPAEPPPRTGRRSPPRGRFRCAAAPKSPWQEIKGSEAGRGSGAGRSATKERGGEGEEGTRPGPPPGPGRRCAPGRAGPPAAAAGTAHREGKGRCGFCTAKPAPLCAPVPTPGLPPTHRAEPSRGGSGPAPLPPRRGSGFPQQREKESCFPLAE